MTFFKDGKPKGGGVKRRENSFGRGNATRKFVGRAPIDNPAGRKRSSSNSDFIVNSASGVKVLSSVVAGATQSARQSLRDFDELVKKSVENDDGSENRKGKGTKFVSSDLESLQRVFSDDIVNRAGVGSSNITDMIRSAAKSSIGKGLTTSALRKRTATSSTINRATPAIDYAKLLIGDRGSLDRFSTKLVFTVDSKLLEEQDIRVFRIFRAKKEVSDSTRQARSRLSIRGIDEIRSATNRTRNRNFGKDVVAHQTRLEANGVQNMLSDTVVVDDITGNRTALVDTSSSLETLRKTGMGNSRSSDDTTLKALSSFIDVKKMQGSMDSSVVNDLKTMRNMQLQNPGLKTTTVLNDAVGRASPPRDTITRLGMQQIRNIREASREKGGLATNKRGSGYVELATVPLSRLKQKSIGNEGSVIEFSFVDESIEFGNTYSYYITSVNGSMVESTRSRIVKMAVERVIPPKPPKRMVAKVDRPFVTLSILADSDASFVEKFEIYRKEESTNKQAAEFAAIMTINGNKGFSVEREKRETIDTGYVQVGESLNAKYGGSTFRDMTVVEGKRYSYRVYSVDIFGNKSQRPKVASIFVNDGRTPIDLKKPTMMAEIDPTTRNTKITMTSDDERIVALFLDRKDLTTHEREFRSMKQPAHKRMGPCRNPSQGCKDGEDVLMRSDDNAWTGYFPRVNGDIVFIDKASRIDHTYQYRVYGVDRFGNRSPYATTQALLITRRAMVNEPVNAKAEFVDGKLNLTWDDGNIDIDPETMIGNRTDFDDNSVNTLFQVERKKLGQELWQQFPLTDKRTLEDRVPIDKDEIKPQYRPEFLEIDSEYIYRVSAYQTGGFISNFSKSIKVSTFTPVLQPSNFRVKSCDHKCEPFYVALNWNTPKTSGVVDRWTIERAEVNNFAASKLNSANVKDINRLKFEHVDDVFREASRSRARVDDSRDKFAMDDVRKNKTLSAQHHYIDDDVRFGNTYFYRLTAYGLNDGNVSEPITRGIKLSDAEFEVKFNAMTTQSERNRLSSKNKPLVMRGLMLRNHGK